jgi:signal transduction histidine kinase
MTDNEAAGGRAVPIDRYPDPAIGYAIVDGGVVVTGTNDAFKTIFGPVESDRPLAEAVERPGVSTDLGSREFRDLLAADDRATAYVSTDAGGYVTRILPPEDDDGDGYVLFIDESAVDGGRAAPETAGDLGVDRLASILSHDLRNPLDVATARLRAGRETGDDEHFDRVERAHDRMERIIEDVLTLTRGSEYVDPEERVDLRAVAESAWSTVDTEAATLTVANGLPVTTADGDRSERLFENLFRNAVEHGDDPEIVVGRLNADGDGFYVADDGPGIPPDERSVVFEPGYSSHDHGTGLGLSIVERIAEAHGWSVAAVEAETGGARVEIRDVQSEDAG